MSLFQAVTLCSLPTIYPCQWRKLSFWMGGNRSEWVFCSKYCAGRLILNSDENNLDFWVKFRSSVDVEGGGQLPSTPYNFCHWAMFSVAPSLLFPARPLPSFSVGLPATSITWFQSKVGGACTLPVTPNNLSPADSRTWYSSPGDLTQALVCLNCLFISRIIVIELMER